MLVFVRDNDVDQALLAIEKKMQRQGVFLGMKLRRACEKPYERKAREKAKGARRQCKRMQREGYQR